ncbi:carbon-nitrogen hydrolase family protein [Paenibacillus methanolicus]|uniref:Putative amidohydrolase n=1 Tax=Paenibacillus methanolicus TaxID=582686 RepID=A0A5S5CDK5_9BACL|nr:carbon-nitrogen hydrolase family protein [Paenibacillus methanolicus]TYP76582.1 putative amidohydrolase [Paenibacillus methanolicus]
MINLVPAFDAEAWRSWTPHEALAPEFRKEVWEGEPVAIIQACARNQFGKWLCAVDGVNGGQNYALDVQYLVTDRMTNRFNGYAMLTWSDAAGSLLSRDYVDRTRVLDERWIGLHRTMTAPEGAASVLVELAFRWSAGGTIVWRRPSLTGKQPLGPRTIRAATTLINTYSGKQADNLADIGTVLEQAGAERADLVCLSECVNEQGCGRRGYGLSGEQIPGGYTNFLSSYARQYGYYIIASLFETEEDVLYNTAVLIDRAGRIAGKYRKTHIPLDEAELGVTPGDDYPVFDTDLGRIGILICWDCYFPEVARLLTLKGAELLVVPTQGNTLIQSLARAVDNGIHVVVAGMWGENPSRIIDPEGNILAEISEQAHGVAIAEIDLDRPYYKRYLSVGDADGEARVLFRQERRPHTYETLLE